VVFQLWKFNVNGLNELGLISFHEGSRVPLVFLAVLARWTRWSDADKCEAYIHDFLRISLASTNYAS
jgi:hypothetical protein